MTVPNPKVEIRFNGSTWVDVTVYVRLRDGISINRGRADETGDPMSPGTCTFSLDNNDGRFSPDVTGSPYYPYVTDGVACRVSMWDGSAWRVRFYGTVQNWNVGWLNSLGTQARTTVTVADTLGAFPAYTMHHAADEVLLDYGPDYYWPLRDTGAPGEPLAGDVEITDNAGDGWAQAAALAMDDSGNHPLFTSSSGKLTLTASGLDVGLNWTALVVILTQPTENGDILKIGGRTITWSTANGFDISPGVTTGATGLPSSWPVMLEISSSGAVGGYGWIQAWESDGTYAAALADSGTLLASARRIILNPTLSGGSVWGAGHLAVFDVTVDTLPGATIAKALLNGRNPAYGSAVDVVANRCGVTIGGAAAGSLSLPATDGRYGADVLAAMAQGSLARVVDDLDGTLTWVPFPPSGTPVALPPEEIDESMTWQTSDIGRYTEATVTWLDGSSYTARRDDGRPSSTSIEGVNADRFKDRAVADWLVWNSASTGKARMPLVPYDLATMSNTDVATLCGVTVASRVSLSSLPPQMPSTALLIVEGINERVSDTEWTLTFNTSPDVYSRLFILDDTTAGVLDSAYILGP